MARRPLQPTEVVDVEWVKNALDLTNKEISGLNHNRENLSSALDTCKDGVKAQVVSIRNILSSHHRLMSDIRSILKSLAKQEEQEFGFEGSGGIREYLNTYKAFSENFTALLHLAQQEDIGAEIMGEIQSMMDTVNQHIPRIYDDLVNFAPPLLSDKGGGDGPVRKPNLASALKRSPEPADNSQSSQKVSALKPRLRSDSPPGGSTSAALAKLATTIRSKTEKITRDPRTGKALQERNSYAVSVWRKVKMKLDGRDPDSNKRSSVAEQVDYVISDATSMDNLCLLYEGWTPWV